jgi:LacI family transcriptional regulator/LacI family purine nucleotide synthesis repressor
MDVTMADVARHAGVSRAAVSLVLNKKSKSQISEKLRKTILKSAKDLGYHPHAAARSLALRKTHTFGLALWEVDYVMQSYFSSIIAGMEEVIGAHDYNLQFVTTTRSGDGHHQNLFFMRKVDEKRIDGLIIIDQLMPDEDIISLKEKNFPFVLVDREIDGFDTHCVIVNNEDGIRQATNHLIELGHEKILFVVENPDFFKIKEMMKGYKSALREAGLDYSDCLVKSLSEYCEFDMKRFDEFFEGNPTAIVTSSDRLAFKMLSVLRKKHIRVPEDVSVVGYNDEPVSSEMNPPLTTVRVPLMKVGEEAAKVLLNLIQFNADSKRVVLNPGLVVRESCARKA